MSGSEATVLTFRQKTDYMHFRSSSLHLFLESGCKDRYSIPGLFCKTQNTKQLENNSPVPLHKLDYRKVLIGERKFEKPAQGPLEEACDNPYELWIWSVITMATLLNQISEQVVWEAQEFLWGKYWNEDHHRKRTALRGHRIVPRSCVWIANAPNIWHWASHSFSLNLSFPIWIRSIIMLFSS